MSQPLRQTQNLVPTFSGGSCLEWQVGGAGILNLVSRSRRWLATTPHQLPIRRSTQPSRAWSLTWGANGWFISQLPLSFQAHVCPLESNSQSPGQNITLTHNITRACLCRLYIFFFQSSYLCILIFLQWAFFYFLNLEIFCPPCLPCLVLPAQGSHTGATPIPHQGPEVLKAHSLVVLKLKEGAYLDSNNWGTHLPSLFPFGIQVLVWECEISCVHPKYKYLIPFLKYRERKPPWHRAPFHRGELITDRS